MSSYLKPTKLLQPVSGSKERRRLSHMSDMDAGREDAKIMEKYRERLRLRREGHNVSRKHPEGGIPANKIRTSEKVEDTKLNDNEIDNTSSRTSKLQK